MKNRFHLSLLAVALIFSVFTPSLEAQNLDFPFYEMPKEPTQQEIDAAKKTLMDYLNPPESATKKEILSRTNFFHGPDEVNKAYQILLRSKKNDVTFLTNPVLALSFRALSLPDLTQEEKSEIFRTITAYYLTRVVSQQWTQEKAQQEIDSLSKNITPSDRKHVAWYIELYSCRFQ
ncbi:MAG: hypothetical protein Q4C70_09495 [Planctomycetia bacterium]|nr:hypothetical protein [Planctomycetia bacterium]